MDVALFPLDTLKTRLQSGRGFLKTGGFTGLYKGILPVIAGSAPTGNVRDDEIYTLNTILNLYMH